MFRKLKRSAGLRRIGEQDERREPVMKILITTDWYTPAVNGVVTSVKNLQRELERRDRSVRRLRSRCGDAVPGPGVERLGQRQDPDLMAPALQLPLQVYYFRTTFHCKVTPRRS